ncbi:Hypothetical protein MVR_LOCUS356 [uncultured virus]|nr:Hypothetical protein MVR_LOCUS356 [uncultured virus]
MSRQPIQSSAPIRQARPFCFPNNQSQSQLQVRPNHELKDHNKQLDQLNAKVNQLLGENAKLLQRIHELGNDTKHQTSQDSMTVSEYVRMRSISVVLGILLGVLFISWHE